MEPSHASIKVTPTDTNSNSEPRQNPNRLLSQQLYHSLIVTRAHDQAHNYSHRVQKLFPIRISRVCCEWEPLDARHCGPLPVAWETFRSKVLGPYVSPQQMAGK